MYQFRKQCVPKLNQLKKLRIGFMQQVAISNIFEKYLVTKDKCPFFYNTNKNGPKKADTDSSFYKQTKNRNETGSNLSLGTRLTVLSKRLRRKRCCDATLSSLRIVKKCGVFFERSRVLVGSQGLKRTK